MLRLARTASHNAGPSPQRHYMSAIRAISFRHAASPAIPTANRHIFATRSFSSTRTIQKGIRPETEEPQPKETWQPVSREPTKLTDEQYHEVADVYFERMVAQFEELQERREDIDVEYSVCQSFITFNERGARFLIPII